MTGTPDVFPPTTPGGTPLVALPAGPRKPDQVKGKLYIKTHGCQMNEYDSAKMADVLWGNALAWTTAFGLVQPAPATADYIARMSAMTAFDRSRQIDAELAA